MVSNADFWTFYLSSKDCCPNFDIEFEESSDSSLDDIVKISSEILAQSFYSDMATRKFPLPSYESQNAIADIDKTTNTCLIFHENGTLWTARKISPIEKKAIFSNLDYKNLD